MFDGTRFASPFDNPDLAGRTVVTASISKSHAAPGFRSGWCVGSAEFSARLLPVVETMLFGNQPFIADMTALAVSKPSEVAKGMATRFARRAALIHARLDSANGLRVHKPEAGMFAVVDIRATGLSGDAFARRLLAEERVAVVPGNAFGPMGEGYVRACYASGYDSIERAIERIGRFVQRYR